MRGLRDLKAPDKRLERRTPPSPDPALVCEGAFPGLAVYGEAYILPVHAEHSNDRMVKGSSRWRKDLSRRDVRQALQLLFRKPRQSFRTWLPSPLDARSRDLSQSPRFKSGSIFKPASLCVRCKRKRKDVVECVRRSTPVCTGQASKIMSACISIRVATMSRCSYAAAAGVSLTGPREASSTHPRAQRGTSSTPRR